MRPDDLRQLLRQQPFRPFRLSRPFRRLRSSRLRPNCPKSFEKGQNGTQERGEAGIYLCMTPLLAQRPSVDRAFERLYRRHVGDVYRYARS